MKKTVHTITVALWAAFARHIDEIDKGADWEKIVEDFTSTTQELYGQSEKQDKLVSDLAFAYLDFLTAHWKEVNNGHSNNTSRT